MDEEEIKRIDDVVRADIKAFEETGEDGAIVCMRAEDLPVENAKTDSIIDYCHRCGAKVTRSNIPTKLNIVCTHCVLEEMHPIPPD